MTELDKDVEQRFEKQFGRLKDFLMNEYMDVEDAEHMEKEIFSFFSQELALAKEEGVREAIEKKVCLHDRYVTSELQKNKSGFIDYHLLRMVDICADCGQDIRHLRLLRK